MFRFSGSLIIILGLSLWLTLSCQQSGPQPSRKAPTSNSQSPLDSKNSKTQGKGFLRLKPLKGQHRDASVHEFYDIDFDPQNLLKLKLILNDLNNIYKNALFALTKDKTCRPKNVFEGLENLISKIEDKTMEIPILSESGFNQKKGRFECEDKQLLFLFNEQTRMNKLVYYECKTRLESNLITYGIKGDQWTLTSSADGFKALIPDQMGLLEVLSDEKYKPRCNIQTESLDDKISIKHANCKDWGQNIMFHESGKETKKTVLFDFKYKSDDSSSSQEEKGILAQVEGRYVKFDQNNNSCLDTGIKRVARTGSKEIEIQDDPATTCQTMAPVNNIPISVKNPNSDCELPEIGKKPEATKDNTPASTTDGSLGHQTDLVDPQSPLQKAPNTQISLGETGSFVENGEEQNEDPSQQNNTIQKSNSELEQQPSPPQPLMMADPDIQPYSMNKTKDVSMTGVVAVAAYQLNQWRSVL